jgi:diguanylate cyclase (GGDEF)-like protein/PAS domain S-box-containing protein
MENLPKVGEEVTKVTQPTDEPQLSHPPTAAVRPGSPTPSPAAVALPDPYRLLFDAHPLAMWVYDLEDLSFLAVNRAAIDLYGFASDEFLRMTIHGIRPPEEIPALLNDLEANSVGHSMGTTTWTHRKRDGTVMEVEVASQSILFEGRRARMVLAHDITQRRVAESETRRSLSLLQATLDSTADGILVVDLDGRIVSCNRRFSQIWDLPAELLDSAQDGTLLALASQRLKEPDLFVRKVRELYADLEAHSFDVLEFSDGRIIERYSIPQHLDGVSVGRVWSFRDVTERRQAESELERRLQFERLITAISGRFISLEGSELDDAIRESLNEIRQFAGVDGCFVAFWSEPDAEVVCDGEWRSGDACLSTADIRALLARPWAARELEHKGVLHVSQLPLVGAEGEGGADVAAESALLTPHGLSSLVLVSVAASNLDGVLGFANRHREKAWNEDGVALLRVAGEIFTRTLERRATERALRSSEERYRSLFERNLAGVFSASADGTIVDCNQAMAHILGHDSRLACLNSSLFEAFVDPLHRDAVVDRLRAGETLSGEELCVRRSDGSAVWVYANLARTFSSAEAERFEGTVVDITHRKNAETQIAYQAYHDALTDLPNRMLFRDRLTQALAAAKRRDHGLGVLFLDLDHFKRVNDTLGHGAGDRLLQDIARRLREIVRDTDTVARIGGDEFTILLPHLNSGEAAAKVAQTILEAVALPADLDGQRLYVTTSIGISLYPADGADAETLLTSADIALYRAKELGRNGYQLCTAAMNARSRARLTLESELRRALERDELRLVYQPEVRVDSGDTVAVEALLRWQHPERGLLSPGEFMEVAEETRLIVPIGEWVLRTACAQAREWLERGLARIRVAVNLSPRQFQSRDLVPTLEAALAAAHLAPRSLEVEITESAAMQNTELTAELLATLREMGIRVTMDDFGTGHTSLSYLQQFTLDALKIDRSFVTHMESARGGNAIVGSIVDLAHGLGLDVVAEGVERESQLQLLRGHRCDFAQGFLISRPVSPAEVEVFCRHASERNDDRPH